MKEADWSKRGVYMRSRHGVRPRWANEALRDPNRVVLSPDPASVSGRSDRTIGWSPSARQVITVITLEDEGVVYGVNGWVANERDKRRYEEGLR